MTMRDPFVCKQNKRLPKAEIPLGEIDGLILYQSRYGKGSSAELVYGEPLRLPGEFFGQNIASYTTDITDFSARLRSFAEKLQPVPTQHHSKPKTFVFKELSTCSHVFLREDTLHGALQPAYTGPYEVLKRGAKTFRLKVKGRDVTVSIDRLKPAYILSDDTPLPKPPNPPQPKPPDVPQQQAGDNIGLRTTRSGRRVRFPDYYRP
ncbi:uncharacterized protein LOC123875848 [Maniola jurtina]|uniref:uncharacterized protein LOC123875848 n=1 Tax=Maniola jurtina TaxID=191418 RepID=UPI001E68D4A5|nr:uncharacterized protein LOC123875848 [Maniola jurtina]